MQSGPARQNLVRAFTQGQSKGEGGMIEYGRELERESK